jgi:hypothetical protein
MPTRGADCRMMRTLHTHIAGYFMHYPLGKMYLSVFDDEEIINTMSPRRTMQPATYSISHADMQCHNVVVEVKIARTRIFFQPGIVFFMDV